MVMFRTNRMKQKKEQLFAGGQYCNRYDIFSKEQPSCFSLLKNILFWASVFYSEYCYDFVTSKRRSFLTSLVKTLIFTLSIYFINFI